MITLAPERSTLQAFLATKIITAPRPKKKQVPMSMLLKLDALYDAARDIGAVSKRDGAILANTILEITLRLSWGTITGKLDTGVDAALVPMKLRQAGWLSKVEAAALEKLIKDGTARPNFVPMMDAIKERLRWLAS